MDEEINIPTAFCDECNMIVPVIREVVELDGDDVPVMIRGMVVDAVFCISCSKFLNSGDKDISIEYYSLSDLEDLGWKATPMEEEDG